MVPTTADVLRRTWPGSIRKHTEPHAGNDPSCLLLALSIDIQLSLLQLFLRGTQRIQCKLSAEKYKLCIPVLVRSHRSSFAKQ